VLGVGVAHEVAAEEVGQGGEERRAHPIEPLDGAIVGEEPAAEPEGMGVLVLGLAHGRPAGVSHQRLGLDAAHQLGERERVGRPRGSLPQQDVPGLVVPEAVGVGRRLAVL